MQERPFFISSCLHVSIAAFAIYLAAPVFAQTRSMFVWQFENGTLSSSWFPPCVSLPISIQPYNFLGNMTSSGGVPPYYMLSFEIGGTPQTTLIGTGNETFSWQCTHRPGTKLLLTVVDSTGSAGGTPPSLYSVTEGQNIDCITEGSGTFNISANVTDEITTCQPWGLRIKGGVQPYNLTLATLNSIIINVTLPYEEDIFTYVNRVDPGSQLLAAVSDATGQWAFGTPFVSTKGLSFNQGLATLLFTHFQALEISIAPVW
ncbi:hypothetical protein BDQ17DRAFT_1250788 [Cyathus striatus]|nr:hypothetical protein BDQ17DRAFT_1250788 [Cyathus striatus]